MAEDDNENPSLEELMENLQLKANELLLRKEWQESVEVYTKFINLCLEQSIELPSLLKIQKSFCLALSNRARSLYKLREFTQALEDCDEALMTESSHFEALICKGKILLRLNKYSLALDCFKKALLLDPQTNGNLETLNEYVEKCKKYVEKCKKLKLLSRTGAFDISNWVINHFRGKLLVLAEFIGPIEIKKSEFSGRGLFAIKDMDAGTLLFVNKAIATERCILSGEDSDQNAKLVMWKNFVDEVVKTTQKWGRIRDWIITLSTGEDEDKLEVPEMSLFKPDGDVDNNLENEDLDKARLMNILDVNSLVEASVSSKVLGKNKDFYGYGLWVLASFINHSCIPNSRRLHIKDYILVHVSRDVKSGEEITLPYFDVLSPLEKRKEMLKEWGFNCNCKRCKFEEETSMKQEMEVTEKWLELGLIDIGSAVHSVEEGMKRMRGIEKGYLRASFWDTYSKVYGSEKVLKEWGRLIPAADVVADSVGEVIGSDERIVKVLMEVLKRSENGGGEMMERVIRNGRRIYGNVVKNRLAIKTLL
ncbi:methyltransferase FGSG_00040-like [Euphorbia lathyris]|uniref:methyltransferase FGSG_00040-like n=1 Tax=Euphorbia lathyris TaxID=212925 RepID=UPI003313EC21